MKDKIKANGLAALASDAEMEKHFAKRTSEHIKQVRKYCKKLDKLFDLPGIVERGDKHDASKYSTAERLPYVYLSWDYKCKREGVKYTIPADMKKNVNAATKHHIMNNRHHPQYFGGVERPVDGSKMTNLDLAEMVADWAAMAKELGNSVKAWANGNIGKAWKFTPKQQVFIYKMISEIE